MSDLALVWNNDLTGADLAMDGFNLLVDQGLRTAVIISLFSDRRAADDDVLPNDGMPGQDSDRRGWWGDAFPVTAGDRIGSRLWLLAREKELPSVLARAKTYAEEALAWMIEDGVAASVTVTAEVSAPGVLGLGIDIQHPDGASTHFDEQWRAMAA